MTVAVDGTPTPTARGSSFTLDQLVRCRSSPNGFRAQAVALVAAAMAPELYSSVEVRHGIGSFGELFAHPPEYQGAPELMCLDLYGEFDVNLLSLMAAPVRVNLSGKDADAAFW